MKFFPNLREKQKTLASFICLAVLSLGSIYWFAIGNLIAGIIVLIAFPIPAIIFLFLFIYYSNFYLLFGESNIVFHHSFMKKDIVINVDESMKIHLPDDKIINSKRLRFVINTSKESLLFKIDKKTVEALLLLYPNNVERYLRLRGIYKQDPKKKKRKMGLIIAGGVSANFLIVAIPIIALVVFSVGMSTNYFKDQERMTDYAYVCGRFGTLFYDNHEIVFQTAFEDHTKDYGNSHGMSDAEMTGSYIVNRDLFYYALSYKDSNGTYGLQIRMRPFDKTTENVEEIYTEIGFATRPYSFSGFDTKMHFYSNGTYLFSYDVVTKAKEDCAYSNDENIADKYFAANGLSRKDAVMNNGLLELDNGSTTKKVNVKNELPDIYKRLKSHSYKAKTVVYLNNEAFIFYDAEYCDYDACLRYNFSSEKLSFANAYWNHIGLGSGYQIIIPVLFE